MPAKAQGKAAARRALRRQRRPSCLSGRVQPGRNALPRQQQPRLHGCLQLSARAWEYCPGTINSGQGLTCSSDAAPSRRPASRTQQRRRLAIACLQLSRGYTLNEMRAGEWSAEGARGGSSSNGAGGRVLVVVVWGGCSPAAQRRITAWAAAPAHSSQAGAGRVRLARDKQGWLSSSWHAAGAASPSSAAPSTATAASPAQAAARQPPQSLPPPPPAGRTMACLWRRA